MGDRLRVRVCGPVGEADVLAGGLVAAEGERRAALFADGDELDLLAVAAELPLERERPADDLSVERAGEAAVAASTQLRTTAASLRDELQALEITKAEAVQAAVAAGHDDVRQLHGTIQLLRDELERLRQENAEQLEKQARAQQDELRQLRGTIAGLREQLEKHHGR